MAAKLFQQFPSLSLSSPLSPHPHLLHSSCVAYSSLISLPLISPSGHLLCMGDLLPVPACHCDCLFPCPFVCSLFGRLPAACACCICSVRCFVVFTCILFCVVLLFSFFMALFTLFGGWAGWLPHGGVLYDLYVSLSSLPPPVSLSPLPLHSGSVWRVGRTFVLLTCALLPGGMSASPSLSRLTHLSLYDVCIHCILTVEMVISFYHFHHLHLTTVGDN